jgi:hypothetical protein
MRVPDLRHGPARVESYHRAIGDFLTGLLATPGRGD